MIRNVLETIVPIIPPIVEKLSIPCFAVFPIKAINTIIANTTVECPNEK